MNENNLQIEQQETTDNTFAKVEPLVMLPYYDQDGITIYNADCLIAMRALRQVDAIVTDPPYGVNLDYDLYDDTMDNWKAMMIKFVPLAMARARVVLFPSGKYEGEKFLFINYPPNWRLCWYKGSTSNISAVGFNDWEMIFVYGEKICFNTHDYFYAQPERKGMYGHPCPKPLDYSMWLISKFTKEGDTVLDPFMGSGTTMIAARKLGRKAVGIELSQKYCDIAIQRLSQMEMF